MRRRLLWLGGALVYVAVVVGLAVCAMATEYPSSSLAYLVMLVVAAPLSSLGFMVQFAGFALLFEPDADGWPIASAVVVLWGAVAIAQVLVFRMLVRSARARRPADG